MENSNLERLKIIARNHCHEIAYIERRNPLLALIDIRTSECKLYAIKDGAYAVVAERLLTKELDDWAVKKAVSRVDYSDIGSLKATVDILSDKLFLVSVAQDSISFGASVADGELYR